MARVIDHTTFPFSYRLVAVGHSPAWTHKQARETARLFRMLGHAATAQGDTVHTDMDRPTLAAHTALYRDIPPMTEVTA
jgi:hypothetical protein